MPSSSDYLLFMTFGNSGFTCQQFNTESIDWHNAGKVYICIEENHFCGNMSSEADLLTAMSDHNRLMFQSNLENHKNYAVSILGLTGKMFLRKNDMFMGLATSARAFEEAV